MFRKRSSGKVGAWVTAGWLTLAAVGQEGLSPGSERANPPKEASGDVGRPDRSAGQAGTTPDRSESKSELLQRHGRVTSDAVYVRSGASQNHYPITKLNKGDTVVILKEQEEWYGIAPPSGSFSLVSQEYVDTADGVHGVINGDRVNIRAGSHFSDDRYQVQVQLSRGAEVTLVSKTEDGYYRIEPPPGAVVYISRKFVVPIRPGESEPAPAPATPRPQPLTGAAPSGRTALTGEAVSAQDATGFVIPATSLSGDDALLLASGATPLRQKLVDLNAALRQEMSQPLAMRKYGPLLEEYRRIAAQQEDALARQYAENRAAQIEYLARLTASAANMHALSFEVERSRTDFREARQRTAPPPVAPRVGYDVEGTLRTSSVYSSSVGPRRYRLVDTRTTPARTIGYVELSSAMSLDIDRYLGRYVGIQALKIRAAEGMVNPVPVYTASRIDILQPPTEGEAGVPGTAAPGSSTLSGSSKPDAGG